VVCMATEELADQVNTVGAVTDRRRVPYVEIAGAS
jgi:hypothetical protein